MQPLRVWAEVDLDRLAANLGRIRARLRSGVGLWMVVKADAYGHGAVAVARRANREGVDRFGVGNVDEALELRAAGVRGRILVLGTIVDHEAPEAVRHRIELGVHTAERCQRLEALAGELGTRVRVHLNVDTGMGRLGVQPARALELLEQIARSPGLELAGTMTHLASDRGAQDPEARAQLECFRRFLDDARRAGLDPVAPHVGNSAAVFTGLDPQFEAVRPGIAVYGILPRGRAAATDLEPVLALRTQVVFFKDLPAGSPVGYGSTWRARRPSRIATLPIGYSDGAPWRLGNRGEVLVRGRRAPIVGRVSMDYTTVDVTDVPGLEVGDAVTLIGEDGGEVIRAEDVASAAGTIAYEITCSIGRRVRRVPLEREVERPRPTPALEVGG